LGLRECVFLYIVSDLVLFDSALKCDLVYPISRFGNI